MKIKLFLHAILKFILGAVLVGLPIFLSAGTLNYTRGWLFMGALFVPMLTVGIILMIRSPELLKKRLDAKESKKEHVMVVAISGVVFLVGFILAGLDFRFHISKLPIGVSIVAAAVFLSAYAIYAEVLRENIYLSRTIKVEEGQNVIDTGLYGIVRHPMYGATLLMFTAMPLILGSLPALAVFLLYPFIIEQRIKAEELLLENELEGYTEYKKRVKYKMIPFIW